MPGIRRRSASENMRIGVIISDEPRINDEIRVSQVRLIGPNGEQVGVIATSVALNLAKEANLDLVEVAPNAKPPVAKLISFPTRRSSDLQASRRQAYRLRQVQVQREDQGP